MNFVSVTRLRIRSWRFAPAFGWYTLLAFIQAKRSKGNLSAIAARQEKLIFWTITVWEEEAAMRFYRNNGTHRKAMPKLAEWCDEATYVHWLQESEEAPDLATAYERLVRDGIVSRVKNPSPAHATRAFAPPPPEKK